MATQDEDYGKSDEFDTSDENERPSGERWAPVGANDGDSDFTDDYKCSDNMESISYNMDRLKLLEEEQEMLNSSLIALTTHFAQVQFRLRQIVDAPTDEKEKLLKELEEFAFRGIPDVPNTVALRNRSSSSSISLCENNGCSGYDEEVESKIALQKSKQRELIEQLKVQLEDLEKYAYETDGQDLPQSVILERQNMIINHLKEKLNFEVDDLCKLPLDDLRWQVDHAINEIVSPLKMKEQLVNQLKTQVADLERFIHYLQGEVSPESLACTCACPVHTTGLKPSQKSKRQIPLMDRNDDSHTKTLNTVRKVITLLHIYLMSQLGCSSERTRGKKDSKTTWRDLRTRLDIAIEHVLEIAAESEESHSDPHDNDDDDDIDLYASDSESPRQHTNAKMTSAVRKHLAVCIRDLMAHGLSSDVRSNSVVPFVGCFPQRRSLTVDQMHPWELIIKYYEFKNGHRYNSSPAQKLSQSFNLALVNERTVSPKQSLLTTVGNIVASHSQYKRSYNSHFKAFICAALNAKKLVPWLRLILQCQYLLENHYMSWSYVVKTGFQDAFHALDRLTTIHFDLPVDLAVRQFQNIKDAF
ncbi:RUN domain-containing protein 1 [Diachasma alloeum]|uniref:RUN domain-containing protein 1 n=1 Tax=Diachasma alloeum TaxID=454923 RepID=UPI0007383A15|nr:RUN domain-containing protein 1 [Diachasma alloeum]